MIYPNDAEGETHCIERWLREEATKNYDEYKADPTRAIPASQVMQHVRKHAALRHAVAVKE